MRKPRQLTEVLQKEDAFYDAPTFSRDNFQKLAIEYNNLVEVVNMLCDKRGIIFDD